jgi:ATP-dependent Clp protease ATP-binding subunit ClpA
VEKAHNDVFNILLQLLDDGRLTDNQGRVVSFKNTLVIMTSNIGAERIMTLAERGSDYEVMRREVLDLLKQSVRPEFLNRIDETIVFHPLDKEVIATIVRLQFALVADRAAAQEIELVLTDAAADQIALWGYDPVFGARPLKRVLQSEVTHRLSEAVLAGKIKSGDKVTVDAEAGQIVLRPEPAGSNGSDRVRTESTAASV